MIFTPYDYIIVKEQVSLMLTQWSWLWLLQRISIVRRAQALLLFLGYICMLLMNVCVLLFAITLINIIYMRLQYSQQKWTFNKASITSRRNVCKIFLSTISFSLLKLFLDWNRTSVCEMCQLIIVIYKCIIYVTNNLTAHSNMRCY